MITTISLVNIHHHTVTRFFLMMRTFKIYFVSNFYIYDTVLLTVVTMLCITSPELTLLITGSVYLLMDISLYLPPPLPSSWQSPCPYHTFSIKFNELLLNFHQIWHICNALCAIISFFCAQDIIFFLIP